MKQQITKEQLNELSDEGRQKLKDWWKPKDGDFAYSYDSIVSDAGSELHEGFIGESIGYDDTFGESSGKYILYPLLSIGQMIEFLKDIDNDLDITYISSGSIWSIGREFVPESIMDEELCDALWEAVKEVLEKEV